MPTVVTHVAPVLALGAGLGSNRISPRLLLAGLGCSVLPDLDVVSFKLGISYSSLLGHRGFSHSLSLALLIGLLAAWAAPKLRCGRLAAFMVCAGAVASHIALDAGTDGGLGVAAFWPFTDARYFFPVTPIEVSPIGITRFLTARGLVVAISELKWVWLPCLATALALRLARRPLRRAAHAKGRPR